MRIKLKAKQIKAIESHFESSDDLKKFNIKRVIVFTTQEIIRILIAANGEQYVTGATTMGSGISSHIYHDLSIRLISIRSCYVCAVLCITFSLPVMAIEKCL